MKSRNILRHSIATLLTLAAASHAASLTWDGGPLASTVDDIITPGAGTWTTGSNNWDDGIANLLNAPWANGDDAVFTGTAGVVTISSPGVMANSLTFNSGYTISGNVLTLGGATPTITSNAVLGVISSSIAGSNGLTLAATGIAGVYLDGNNTYTGVTTATAGFIVARNAGALGGSADGTVVASGATLQIEGNGVVNVHFANEAVTISGTGVGGNRGALANWTGDNTWGGSVTMAADSSVHVNGGSLRVNGVVGGAGFNLLKTGGGQLTLGGSASNTYSGTTTIDVGTLVLGKTGGAKAIIGPVTMGAVNTNQPNLRMLANDQFDPSVVITFVNASGNWARFDLQGTSQTLAGIQNTTGGGIVQNERFGGGGTASAATLTINNSADFSFNGYIRDRDGGAGIFLMNIVKTGAGRQTIGGNNVNYTGTTTVSQGTYELQQTLNYASPTAVAAGATFEINGTADGFQNNQTGATIALAGTLNRTGAAGWMVWNGKLSPTAGTAALNLRNDGASPAGGAGWLFLDGGLGSSGSQTLAINHTLADGVTPNNNLATVLRNNNSTYAGSLNVTNGSLVLAGGGGVTGTQLANADVMLNNATLQMASVFASNQNTANQLKSLSGTGTLSLGGAALSVGLNDGTGAFSGAVTGTGSITKVGAGTQTFSGAVGHTGATAVNAGTLRLDYSSVDAGKLADGAVLTLGGGTLDLVGGTHTEAVASTTLAAGTASAITRTGNSVLQMNTITRNAGASLTFSAPGIATTNNGNDASGILGTWATIGGDWATNSTGGAGGSIIAFSAYTDVNRLGGTIANAATANVRIIEAGAGTNVTLAAGGTTTINSLVQSAAGGAATVDIGAGNTLRLGATGGILLPSGNPALTISNGTLTAGGADDTAGSVDVNNLSATTGITIGSAITNNGTGAVSLNKLGAGVMTVTGPNSYTGGTNLSGGTLAFNNGSLGSTGTITVGGATLRWNGSNTEDVSARVALSNALTATFDTNGNDVAFATAIGSATSAGVTKAGAGTLTLSGANTHTGVTTVQGGTLALNNVNALQSSTLDTGTAGSQAVTFAVAGVNTYNIGGLQGADALEIGGNTVSVGAGNTNTNFSGVLSGAGGSMTKVGNGTLTLSGSASNTFTGPLTLASNSQVILSKTGGAFAVAGDLILAAPAVRGIVSTTEDNQFAPGSVLRFTSAGDTRLELKGTTQTLGGIENSAVVTKTFHAVQHSEFGAPPAKDTTSQLILDVAGANSFTFNTVNGALRDFTGGTLSLVKNGTGTQTLAGAGVTYAGATALNAGTLNLFNASGYNSPTTVAGGATLILSNSATHGMGNGAAITLNSGATLFHNGQTDNAAFITLAGAFTVAGTTTINQNSVTNTTGTNKNIFLDGGLHGSGTLTINAANPGNAVEFRNNNSTFAGTIIVNGIASTVVNAGSGISVGGASTALERADITVNGTMELLNQGLGWAGATPGDFAMGALNGTGAVVANFTGGGETRVKIGYTGNNGNFSGVIADGTGNRVTLTKFGAGTQILSGANTYTGITTINAGTLQIGDGGTSGTIGNGAITNNAALVINRSDAVAIHGAIGGIGSVTKNGAGTLTLTNNSTYQGPTTVNGGTLKLGASQTLNVSSAIWLDATDSATITTNGGGEVTTWANKGTLGVAGDATAAAGQEPVVATSVPAMNNRPVIRFDSTAGGVAPFDRLTNATNFAAGNVTVMYAGRLNGGDSNTRLVGGLANNWLLGTWGGNSESAYFNSGFLSNVTPADTVARIYTGTIATGGASKFFINGAERGSGGVNVNTQGPNGLILGGGFNATENSDGDIGEFLVFTSVLTSQERGEVESYLNRKWRGGNTNVLPTTTALSLTTSGATLDLNGVTQTVASISGVAGTTIALGGGALTVGNATNTVFAGAITGTGGFTKVGSGTLELSGTSSPAGGPVLVQGGTLLVSGGLSGSLVEVQSGGTLGGTGTIGSDLYITGTGKLSPGASPGTLTVTGTTLDFSDAVNAANSQSLVFELGTTSDRVNLTTGQFGIGTGVLEFDDFAFTAGSGFGPGTYTLFDSTQDVFGTLGGSLSGTVGGFSATIALADTNNDIVLNVVPEPGSAALLLGGLAMLASRRRRK